MQGEKVSADTTKVEPFKKELQELLEREALTLEQLYNCDETGLCYRMLPSKTLASRSEKEASGMKNQKDRVTLMACCNATGTHRLPLMFIGKAKSPRCFKNVNKEALPVHNCSQKNAWVNTEIFIDWFHNQFVPAVTKHLKEKGLTVKALLVLDNAPAHPNAASLVSQDGNIKAMFLPSNTTSILQPLDQGMLEALKRRYRKSLLQKLLLEDQEGRSIIQFVKQINMKDVVYMTASAWDDIPPLTLARSWNKLLRIDDSSEPSSSPEESDPTIAEKQCEELAHQLDPSLQDEEIASWIYEDSDDQGYQLLTDDDIVQHVTQQEEVNDEKDEDESEESHNIPSCGDVKDMLDKCSLWYERQDESTSTSLLLLKRVRDLAATKRFLKLKQLKLDSFLAKSQ